MTGTKSWDEVKAELFTPEEQAESAMEAAETSESWDDMKLVLPDGPPVQTRTSLAIDRFETELWWFETAKAALTGLCSTPPPHRPSPLTAAKLAAEYADALMAVRDERRAGK